MVDVELDWIEYNRQIPLFTSSYIEPKEKSFSRSHHEWGISLDNIAITI